MRKLITTICLTLIITSTFAQLPNNFKIDECVMSIGTDFKIVGSKSGYIDEEILSLTSNFKLKLNGNLYARSKEKLISIGSEIDIFDKNGKKIGSVEEIIFSSFFGITSTYNIFNGAGKKIAYSTKHDLMSTKFTVKNTSGKVVCVITRPAFNIMSDTWTVSFKDPDFDKRLVVFIPCYKTLRDNEEGDDD